MALRALVLLVLAASVCSTVRGAAQSWETDRVLVRYKPGAVVTRSALSPGLRLQKSLGAKEEIQVYDITDGTAVQDKVKELRSMPDVDVAEPDYKMRVGTIPNDEKFSQQWHLPKISAPEAWDISTGLPDVKVCVIDSGARMDHPDLAGNIIKGFNLVPKNQNAKNPVAPTPTDPFYYNYNDTLFHGTLVAGTLAAMSNNLKGVTGVAWNVKLVICKFVWDEGTGYVSDAMKCLELCREEGAMITSNSYGGIPYSQILYDELQKAKAAGQLYVVAAANNAIDMDVEPQYPGGYDLSNILTVGSSGQTDHLSTFSNYGKTKVHLTAPGEDIFTTSFDGKFGSASGTSMATPIVTGAAALVQSVAQAVGTTLTYPQIKVLLLKSVDRVPQLADKVQTGGRLNIAKALKLTRALVRLRNPVMAPSWEANPFSYFVIRQTAYTHVSSCRTWLSDSQEAYVKAAEALTGLNTVQVKCQVANRYNERRILIVAVTTPTTLKEARSLSSKMNDAVQDGTFRTLVSVQDGAASLPTRETEGGCVLGFDECPKDYLTQRSRHV